MRTPEQRDYELRAVIARLGPTKKCTKCLKVLPRSDFRTRTGTINPYSHAECKDCARVRVAANKRHAYDVKGERYQKILAYNRIYHKRYQIKMMSTPEGREILNKPRRAYRIREKLRLQRVVEDAALNPLAKKLFG